MSPEVWHCISPDRKPRLLWEAKARRKPEVQRQRVGRGRRPTRMKLRSPPPTPGALPAQPLLSLNPSCCEASLQASGRVGTDKDACFKAPKGGRSQFGEDGGALGRLVQNSTNEYGEVTKPTERWLEPRHDILKHHPGPSEVTSLRAKTARFYISILSSKANTKFRVIRRPSKVRALKYR